MIAPGEQIKRATGDVFGRIYEYFLAKFSIQKAHDNGEFFTPSSLVQLIVNVIEPDYGTVFDPACGSGGMFVQTKKYQEIIADYNRRRIEWPWSKRSRESQRSSPRWTMRRSGTSGRDCLKTNSRSLICY
jgi:type I restriction enzyme M protein